MTGYKGSDAWFEHADEADDRWHNTGTVTQDVGQDPLDERRIVHVTAEAGTGSRYSVVVTPLAGGSIYEGGGEVLVSVLSPWRTCYPMQRDGDVHWRYIEEKFLPRSECHGGDLAALTRTIARALDRPAILPERPKEG